MFRQLEFKYFTNISSLYGDFFPNKKQNPFSQIHVLLKYSRFPAVFVLFGFFQPLKRDFFLFLTHSNTNQI